MGDLYNTRKLSEGRPSLANYSPRPGGALVLVYRYLPSLPRRWICTVLWDSPRDGPERSGASSKQVSSLFFNACGGILGSVRSR